jgi:hypothetical protein
MKRMFGLSINFDKDAEGRRDEPINFLKRFWEVTGAETGVRSSGKCTSEPEGHFVPKMVEADNSS